MVATVRSRPLTLYCEVLAVSIDMFVDRGGAVSSSTFDEYSRPSDSSSRCATNDPSGGGDPAGELRGPAAIGARYGHLFSNVKGEHVDVKHRLYGDNFVVDDKIWTAQVVGQFLGIPGNGRRISIRVLHVFEFCDGLIRRENVWIDTGAAIAQLTAGTVAHDDA